MTGRGRNEMIATLSRVGLVVLALSLCHASAPAQAVSQPGAAAAPFRLTTLDGVDVSLATFRGKPLIINFFASWCDPCREEIPLLNDLARKAAAGYAVLGIAVEDRRAAVVRFAQDARLEFPIALDSSSAVKRAYRIFGPPATFFVDGEGTIRDAVIGPITAERIRLAMHRMGVTPR